MRHGELWTDRRIGGIEIATLDVEGGGGESEECVVGQEARGERCQSVDGGVCEVCAVPMLGMFVGMDC